ncbi:hypothetical protein BOS5A_10643 [Bosea sp. EC-HK365B]|nr:hypothetical protein BOSE21B_10431 [Bosea sp. 21B]CAD5266556.1 hypothetical protein BOSE7B_150704 [Bosea sp. 7B]VVT44952.1 hypothetical protein BOS5A_10643 [Bosea sp. EC-HK365B]VXC52188.1 hypothetical protein BOSE127_190331 [Bosea sp. 127]
MPDEIVPRSSGGGGGAGCAIGKSAALAMADALTAMAPASARVFRLRMAGPFEFACSWTQVHASYRWGNLAMDFLNDT